jgi:hypothetical protein
MARKKSSKGADNDQQRQDLPGYPHYPPKEDMMRKGQRVEKNLDGDDSKVEKPASTPVLPDTDAAGGRENKRYDFTEDDLQALGPVDLSLDLGDDEQLKQRTQPVDFAAADLDVPGSEIDDDDEDNGSEDEENNPYSLGGDAHSDLEEGRQ